MVIARHGPKSDKEKRRVSKFPRWVPTTSWMALMGHDRASCALTDSTATVPIQPVGKDLVKE